MQEPEADGIWTHSFSVPAQVFYITEPLYNEEIAEICTKMVQLTHAKNVKNAYFVVIFEECATIMFISPHKGIFNAIVKGRLRPILEDVRQVIANLALELISQIIKENAHHGRN